jgi:predicted AlkP superfamily pyrophosphatase or phosphodiesterase
MLIYLPHLDYALQKLGPEHPQISSEVAAIDGVVGNLIDFFDRKGARLIILSEYGIEAVDDAVHINRFLHEDHALRVREEGGRELLDPGASQAFAVTDHQIAHVYVRDASRLPRYMDLCRGIDGVELVLDRHAQKQHGIDHPRSGDLVLVATRRRWFSYDYWLDDRKAPDFARTVEIHRKPGYDPCELFIDPRMKWPRLQVAWKLLKRRTGFRGLLDVIPLDASLVRGSHGRVEQPPELQPVLISQHHQSGGGDLPCTAVRDVILSSLFED